jgi:phosphatidate phosphatase PAH1
MKKIINKFDKVSTKIHNKIKQANLLSGASDIITTRWKTGEIKSTPFFVCFGHKAMKLKNKNIMVIVNNIEIPNAKFIVN